MINIRSTSHNKTFNVVFILFLSLSCSLSLTSAAAELTLEYRNNSYGDQVMIKPDLLLRNVSGSALNLGEVSLRYWYSNETGSSQNALIFHVLNSGNWQSPCYYPFNCITRNFGSVADHNYVELGFTSSVGTLSPGKYINLQFGIHAANWAAFVQENDFSFGPSTGSYQAWSSISVYRNGELVYGNEPTSQQSACSQAEPDVLGYSWTPEVIDGSSNNPVTFRARVLGGATDVALCLASSPNAACSATLELEGPDENCNYSVTLSAAQALQYHNVATNLHRPVVGFLKTLDKTVNVLANVYSSDIPLCEVSVISSEAQQCNKVVNLALPDIFAGETDLSSTKRREISNTFYQYYEDDYDFLAIVSVSQSYVQNPSYMGVKNEIAGIGTALFDRTSDYSSAGRLRGNIALPISQSFDGAANLFSHEIAHAWVNFVNLPLLGQTSPHWPISDLANGILGYSMPGGQGLQFGSILTINNGVVQKSVDPNPKEFKDLTLYLMGLIPASEVATHFVMDDATNPNNFPSANFTEFTVDDVIAANGVRQPAYPNDQSHFRIATVLVSSTPLSQQAMSFFNYYAGRMELLDDTVLAKTGLSPLTPHKPFHSATGGTATLEANIE